MSDLIVSIILSDVTIILVLLAMLGVVSSWAFREKEYPGYVLGWLVGIFFVIVYQSLGGETTSPVPAEELASETNVRLNFFVVLLTTIIGLLAGFGVLTTIQRYGTTRARRGLTIAVMTASLIVTVFMLTIAAEELRRVMGLFALAFAIGALSNLVIGGSNVLRFGSGSSRTAQPSQPPQRFGAQAAPPDNNPPPGTQPPPTPQGPPQAPANDVQQRFEQLRRRVDGDDR